MNTEYLDIYYLKKLIQIKIRNLIEILGDFKKKKCIVS